MFNIFKRKPKQLSFHEINTILKYTRCEYMQREYGIPRRFYWDLPVSFIDRIDKEMIQEIEERKQYYDLLNGT